MIFLLIQIGTCLLSEIIPPIFPKSEIENGEARIADNPKSEIITYV